MTAEQDEVPIPQQINQLLLETSNSEDDLVELSEQLLQLCKQSTLSGHGDEFRDAVLAILLDVDLDSFAIPSATASFQAGHSRKLRLLKILFELVSSRYRPGARQRQNEPVTESSESSDSELDQNTMTFVLWSLPVLMWSWVSLPRPRPEFILQLGADDNHGILHDLKCLQEWIDALECCLVGYYRLFSDISAKKSHNCLQKLDRLDTVKNVLQSPSVYCRKSVPYSNIPSDTNKNLQKARVSHFIPDPSSVLPAGDLSVVSITPLTKPIVIEGLLRMYSENVSGSQISVDSLVIIMLLIERLLCTGVDNSPVQFDPDYSFAHISQLPSVAIQKFHKASIFVWHRVSGSFASMTTSPTSSAESPVRLTHRFSMASGNHNWSSSFSRKHSDGASHHLPFQNHVLNSPNLHRPLHTVVSPIYQHPVLLSQHSTLQNILNRPFTAQSSFSNVAFPVSPQPPIDNKRLNMLGSNSQLNQAASATFKSTVTPSSATSHISSTMALSPHSPIRMTMVSSLAIEFDPRLTLSRDTFRLMLTILQFCHVYMTHKSDCDLYKTMKPDFSIVTYQGIWKRILQSGSLGTVLEQHSSVHDLVSEIENLNTSSMSTMERRRKDSYQPSTLQTAFETILKRAATNLYHRSTYDLKYETMMGSKCFLMELVHTFDSVKETAGNIITAIQAAQDAAAAAAATSPLTTSQTAASLLTRQRTNSTSTTSTAHKLYQNGN